MRTLADLKEILNRTAREIVEVQPEPDQWDTPVIYLMEALEVSALGGDGLESYDAMLAKIRDAIADRLDEGRWQV
jgi:hypothetical protein